MILILTLFFLQTMLEEESKAEEDSDNHIKTKSEPSSSANATSDQPQPVDWKPQDKCYFCVDGKLLKVNEIGELVAEAGPVHPETELNKHVSSYAFIQVRRLPVTLIRRLSNRTIPVQVQIRSRNRPVTTNNCHRTSSQKTWKRC